VGEGLLLRIYLPAKTWLAEETLHLYRVRWQVEWCFRRWKTLCELKRLPAHPSTIAQVVLQAKVVSIRLLHHRLEGAPYGRCDAYISVKQGKWLSRIQDRNGLPLSTARRNGGSNAVGGPV